MLLDFFFHLEGQVLSGITYSRKLAQVSTELPFQKAPEFHQFSPLLT